MPTEGRTFTVARLGALQETIRRERRTADRFIRQSQHGTSLAKEPEGSPLLQTPFCFGAPPGMPAEVEHLRRMRPESIQRQLRSTRSLPQLLPLQGHYRPEGAPPQLSPVPAASAAPAVAAKGLLPLPALLPAPGTAPGPAPVPPRPNTDLQKIAAHRTWLKERLVEAEEDTAMDPLSLYIMRKHSRRFLPGSYYDLELKDKQKHRRVLGSINSEAGGLLAQTPANRGGSRS